MRTTARPLPAFLEGYQSSFRPNCTWRDVVDVLVIAPAVGETPEGVKTIALGRLKFARFNKVEYLRAKLQIQPLTESAFLSTPKNPRSPDRAR